MPNGVTHRLVADDDPAAPRPSRVPLIAGPAVALVVIASVASVVGWALSRPAPLEPAPEPVVVHTYQQVKPILAAASVELPPVSVKRAIPANAARVKPAKAMEPFAKSAVRPIPYTFPGEGPQVKGVNVPIPITWKWTYEYLDEQTLNALLNNVPQLDLDPEYAKRSKEKVAELAKDILKKTEKDKDAFVKGLIKERADLAGLPFLLGKDCGLDKNDSRQLVCFATAIREGIASANKSSSSLSKGQTRMPEDADPAAYRFFASTRKVPTEMVPAMRQILTVQNKDYRFLMAKRLQEVKGRKATEAMVQLALFDLNADVRKQAVKELSTRPREEYLDEIMKGFRYPWPPIAKHASEAAVSLRLNELIPELVDMFQKPDPSAPYTVKTKDGKEKTVVRELVRINHHRNCMLCHLPAEKLTAREALTVPIGPAPSMQDELPPPNSPVYYSERRGITLVRGDVTYLRQDFSVIQQVPNAYKWPTMQRFDFFVREREVTGAAVVNREDSPYAQAVLITLQELTGRAGSMKAASWEEEVRNAPARARAKAK